MSLPPLSCNVCGQPVAASEAYMTACSHLLCTKHGTSITSCPVCLAALQPGHCSPLDFAHKMSTREVSLLRSIAISSPSEVAQLLVEANAFVLRQATFQYSALHSKSSKTLQSCDARNAELVVRNDQLMTDLDSVTHEAQKTNAVVAELRQDLRRVEQQQIQGHGGGGGQRRGVGGQGHGGAQGVSGFSTGGNNNNHQRPKLTLQDRPPNMLLHVQEVQDHSHRNRHEEECRIREEDLRRRQIQQQQQQQQQLQQQQQQQQLQQQQRSAIGAPPSTNLHSLGGNHGSSSSSSRIGTGGGSSSYFSKTSAGEQQNGQNGTQGGYHTPGRISSNRHGGNTRYTPSNRRRAVSSRKSSSFVRARSVAGTPNSYLRSATPRMDFKSVRGRVGGARLQ